MRGETQCHLVRSPLGTVYVYSRSGRPLRITISSQANRNPVSASPPPPRVADVMEAIGDFFAGKEVSRHVTSMLLSDPRFTPFTKRVYSVVVSISCGNTLSYAEVARRAGFHGAARAVGEAMRRNPFPLLIPCHRVVRSDGILGGYSGPPDAKTWLLEREGLSIDRTRQAPRLKGHAM